MVQAVVKRPCHGSGGCQEALPWFRWLSRGLAMVQVVVKRPCHGSGGCQEALPWFRRLSRALVMAHAVVTAETRIQSQISPFDILGGRSGSGTGFSLSASALSQLISCTHLSYKDKGAKLVNLPKVMPFRQSGSIR
jgi:hypothetical protein